jgi:hypothetical protein
MLVSLRQTLGGGVGDGSKEMLLFSRVDSHPLYSSLLVTGKKNNILFFK